MTITFSSPGEGEAAPRRKRRLPTFLTTRAPAPEVTTSAHTLQQRSTVFLAAAALLDYPGENWPEVLDAVEEALSSLPEASATPSRPSFRGRVQPASARLRKPTWRPSIRSVAAA